MDGGVLTLPALEAALNSDVNADDIGPCPECGAELWPESHAGIRLDRCAGCGGLWFDEGELASFSSKVRQEELKEGALRAVFVVGPGEPDGCPRCRAGDLRRGRVGDVDVHLCDACGGFFLARNALQSLSDLARTRPSRTPLSALDGLDLEYVLDFLRKLIR